MLQSHLLDATKELVRNRPRTQTYKVISETTGISLQFLQDLMADRIKDPGVIRIEKLYNYFSAENLMDRQQAQAR